VSIIPDPREAQRLHALYAGNPVVLVAEQALRSFGAISAAQAEKLLGTWAHTPELTQLERRAVLARFTPEPAGHQGDPIVHIAVRTLHSFGDVHRETAATLLESWHRYADLSEQQRQAILAQFPQREYPTRGPLGEGNSGPGGAL
jgi:hypothetical protein